MKFSKWLLVAFCMTCFSAHAADLFFIVGQTGTRSHGQRGHASAEVKQLNWAVGTRFASVAGQSCQANGCPEIPPVDGFVQSFANTWTSLTKNDAHFLIYRKPDVALTKAGADEQGYWTDFEARKGVYQNALSEFRKAQQGATRNTSEGTARRYLIWVQNEADARASVAVAVTEYKAKLIELFDRFNKDLASADKPFDAMFIVSSGFVREIKPDGAMNDSGKLNAIVKAQDSASAQGKIVMVSRSMRRSLPDCAHSQEHRGCRSKDQLGYQSWSYEMLGAEVARNAFTYHAKGIKPFLPVSCKQEPASCAGTKDIYRGIAKGDATRTPVYGTDPDEFDAAAYNVSRMRIALFQDGAPGRIPLYRTTAKDGAGVGTEPDSPKTKPLGYCYSAPKGNANARLMLIQQDGMSDLARLSTPGNEGNPSTRPGEKTLCYVN